MESFNFTIEEKNGNLIANVECTGFFNQMLESGETDYLIGMFKEAIYGISFDIRKNKTCCNEDMVDLILSLIED